MSVKEEAKHESCIEFSGGSESLQLLKKFEKDKEKPLLLCFLHKDMDSFEDLLLDYARLKGFNIKFVIDLNVESFHSNYDFVNNIYLSPLTRTADELGIKIIFNGRKRVDFIERCLYNDAPTRPPRMKTTEGLIVKFPLWNRETK